ncbi:hypothetical protein [Haladaptatus paucihalophilus]|uniref:Uncharacterized protein n=2 Tax=Haladaptatus paucihalophilus DX253 TaxID=797209 RepID=A0A1M6ZPG7_HALPU|nr:hypothetical protein [Haladaptatus paucihalophilus]SHL32351.1 hypothetical protein SAMN05444342_3523 [Haladaptatus paucihalophilus DX253]
MKPNWQRIGRVLLILSIVFLVVSPGFSMASSEDHTTTSTTSGQADGHNDGGQHGTETATESGHGGKTDAGESQSESGHSHEGEGHSGDEEGFVNGWLMIVGGLFLLGTVATAPVYRYTSTRRQNFTASPIHFGVALLVLFTAAVHFYLYFEHGEQIMALAGLGFLGGIGLFFIDVNRLYLYGVGILYTAVQILLWITDGMPHVGSFGLIDKVVQVLLIIALGFLLLRHRQRARH